MMLNEKQKVEYAFDLIEAAKRAVEDLLPSRERSLSLTKLDEAEMWLERAINDPANKDNG